ncbi:MAG TPA: glycogen/starch/alpha-glucan family phosphorylase, partial [Gammaproteobacteria bacterium]|nr:glycogen/starch/alpha-glucan family phosphorylase [Gammaproteobacteria bacterium]
MDAKNRSPVDLPLNVDALGLDKESLKRSLADRLEYTAGKDTITATTRDWFNVCAHVVRDRCIERWMQTMRTYYNADAKRVYYLSLEFLLGRTLSDSLLNLGFYDALRETVEEAGLDFEQICAIEPDAALGNGGLGRLAACLLESMATLGIPGYGYGIRYEYGMFKQRIENGRQAEQPDNWLRYGNPWEFPRAEVLYPVKFYGRVIEYPDEYGRLRHHWVDTSEVMAMAYDSPIPGFDTNTANNLRLWSAKSSRDFDLRLFNQGNYIEAVEDKNESENISKVLYPNDSNTNGKELRLKQQYFFVCASLQDILHRHKKFHDSFDQLPDKVAIQLNDTHPSIAIPELMRLLIDLHRLDWDHAWHITERVFAYTNHTLMPESLEAWPVDLFERLLPRHMQIIYEINQRFLHDVMHRHPGEPALLRRLSLINEDGHRAIRMAHLAIVGSHKVNGVSKIHTDLMRHTIFGDFYRLFPEKFINITNGITPRRWLNQANPALRDLISARIGADWLTDLGRLKGLVAAADDPDFQQAFRRIKQCNKERLAGMIRANLGISIDPNS